MEDLERILAEHPFLEGLEPHLLSILVGCAKNVRFDADTFIFRAGDQADAFYLIRYGQVGIEIYSHHGGPLTIQTLGEGEVLGWSWLVPPYRWRFDARTISLVRAIALDGKCLREKCEANHDLGYELFKRFSTIIEERLQAMRLQLLDVYSNRP